MRRARPRSSVREGARLAKNVRRSSGDWRAPTQTSERWRPAFAVTRGLLSGRGSRQGSEAWSDAKISFSARSSASPSRNRRFADRRALVATLAGLRQEEADLADEAGALGADAVALAKQAETVVQRKQTLVEQAADLQVQAANLQVQAADLQTQAANLQTQKVELRGSSNRRRASNSEAEQLQTTLTNELTKAGGDERGTDAPRQAQNGLTATLGVKPSRRRGSTRPATP